MRKKEQIRLALQQAIDAIATWWPESFEGGKDLTLCLNLKNIKFWVLEGSYLTATQKATNLKLVSLKKHDTLVGAKKALTGNLDYLTSLIEDRIQHV